MKKIKISIVLCAIMTLCACNDTANTKLYRPSNGAESISVIEDGDTISICEVGREDRQEKLLWKFYKKEQYYYLANSDGKRILVMSNYLMSGANDAKTGLYQDNKTNIGNKEASVIESALLSNDTMTYKYGNVSGNKIQCFHYDSNRKLVISEHVKMNNKYNKSGEYQHYVIYIENAGDSLIATSISINDTIRIKMIYDQNYKIKNIQNWMQYTTYKPDKQ